MISTFPDPSVPSPAARPKLSGLAIASLVCGIAGFCTAGLAGIAGLILGIIGLGKINKSGGRLKGQGLAIAGIVVSGISVLLIPVLIAILLPAISSAKDAARLAVSMNNVKQLGMSAQMYANDNREKLPPAAEWPAMFQQRYDLTPGVLADPADPQGGRVYAMNAAVTRTQQPEASRTVLFFECRPGAPPAGGPELLPEKPRYGNRYVIGFLDGHVEAVPPEQVHGLVWQPQK